MSRLWFWPAGVVAAFAAFVMAVWGPLKYGGAEGPATFVVIAIALFAYDVGRIVEQEWNHPRPR